MTMAFVDDERASSLGGFAETESQAYRTDAVSKFVDEPMDQMLISGKKQEEEDSQAVFSKKNALGGNRPASQAYNSAVPRSNLLMHGVVNQKQKQQLLRSNFMENASDYAISQAINENGRLFQSIPDSQDDITYLGAGGLEDFSSVAQQYHHHATYHQTELR